jgi:hypothetical protein
MIFISGDVSEGSENDLLLKEIIGPDWKVQTGATQPVYSPGASPGYKHEEYWPSVLSRAEERKRSQQEQEQKQDAPVVPAAVEETSSSSPSEI